MESVWNQTRKKHKKRSYTPNHFFSSPSKKATIPSTITFTIKEATTVAQTVIRVSTTTPTAKIHPESNTSRKNGHTTQKQNLPHSSPENTFTPPNQCSVPCSAQRSIEKRASARRQNAQATQTMMINKKMPSIKDQEQLMMKLVHSWLVEHDPQCIPELGDELQPVLENLVDVILEMLEQLCVSQKPHDLLLPLFLYANRYVKKAGVHHNQLANLLITSMVVTLKLWDDEAGVWNNDVAAAYGRNLDDMNELERLFLQYLEYNLFLTPEQVFLFAVDCKFARQSRDITHNNPNISTTSTATKESTSNGSSSSEPLRKRKIEAVSCAPLEDAHWKVNTAKQQKC